MKWGVVALIVLCVACDDDDEINEELVDAYATVGIHVYATTEYSNGVTQVVGEITQPVDHANPDSPTFLQRVVVYHRNFDAPFVFETEGYSLSSQTYITEPTSLLEANEAQVEHRGFGYSTFDDVSFVTLAQSAADHHALIGALRGLYSGAFVATGGSKGGVAALALRHFYPSDLDGVVAYVAPLTTGLRDSKFLPYIDTLGDDDCRTRLRNFQHDALASPRREELTDDLADALDELGAHVDRLGVDKIFELAVRELRFTFWQYGGASRCSSIPNVASAEDGAVLDFVDQTAYFLYSTDEGLEADRAYIWQSAAELGYPADDAAALADVVRYSEPETPLQLLAALGLTPPTYDNTTMTAIADTLASGAPHVLLVYGANDPWTAGAFNVTGEGSARYIAPDANHYAGIQDLTEADRAAATAALQSWVAR